MKNIHLLKTQDATMMSKGLNGILCLSLSLKTFIQNWNDDFINQHMYITSDEEIKEGDFYYDLDLNKLHRLRNGKEVSFNTLKKIVITTDQDLIKNGVQEIPYIFLDWYIYNQACDEIQVIYEPKNYLNPSEGWEYVIITPKGDGFSTGSDLSELDIPTEIDDYIPQTVYEAADEYANELPEPYNYGINPDKKSGFIAGAEWDRKNADFECELKCIESFGKGYDAGYEEKEKEGLFNKEKVINLMIHSYKMSASYTLDDLHKWIENNL